MVNMSDEHSDGLEFTYTVKNHSNLKSGRATIHLGESPTLHLINNSKNEIHLIEGASLTLCYTLSGSPTPQVSLIRITPSKAETAVQTSRYTVQGNCLYFGPLRQADTGLLSVQAVNCFNTSMFPLSLQVSSKRQLILYGSFNLFSKQMSYFVNILVVLIVKSVVFYVASEMPENTTEPSNNIIANSYETQVIKTFRILPQTKPVEIVRGTQQARVYLDDSSDDITVSVWVVAAVGGACALLVVTVFVIFCCKLRKRRNDLENGSKDELDGEYEVQLAPGAYNSLPCKPTSANASSVQTTENNFPKPNSTLNNPIEFESAYDTLTAQGRRGKL
jgi:hypothetical protein